MNTERYINALDVWDGSAKAQRHTERMESELRAALSAVESAARPALSLDDVLHAVAPPEIAAALNAAPKHRDEYAVTQPATTAAIAAGRAS